MTHPTHETRTGPRWTTTWSSARAQEPPRLICTDCGLSAGVVVKWPSGTVLHANGRDCVIHLREALDAALRVEQTLLAEVVEGETAAHAIQTLLAHGWRRLEAGVLLAPDGAAP